MDAFVLFLQSLNPQYPYLFSIKSDSASLANRLLCHIGELGHWTVLMLATHIFAPNSRLESLVRFCHKCIDMNEQATPDFLSSSQTNIGLDQSSTWFSIVINELLLCVFRQVSSHTDIRTIFHLLGEQNEFYKRFEPLFSLLEEQPSPIPFDWSLLMYSDRCYRSVMPLIEKLIKHDRFDLVDEIVNCVDIEIDMTLFERFKCSFDDYNHNPDTDDKELTDAFDSICQGHQDILKRLKKPILYSDFLLSIRCSSSKLVRLLLLIFANEAQQLPETYDYASIQAEQRVKQPLSSKLWNVLVDFVHDYQNKPIVEQVFGYMVNLFSTSILDQLALKTLISNDFDDYLRIYEDIEIEEEPVLEETYSTIVPKNEFEAKLLKNVPLGSKLSPMKDSQLSNMLSGKFDIVQ